MEQAYLYSHLVVKLPIEVTLPEWHHDPGPDKEPLSDLQVSSQREVDHVIPAAQGIEINLELA